MDLVKNKETIFDVIGTMYTAVTYHELFKEAALDGDDKLEYGMEWQQILTALASQVETSGLVESGALREAFNKIDSNGSGSLDSEELLAMVSHKAQGTTTRTERAASRRTPSHVTTPHATRDNRYPLPTLHPEPRTPHPAPRTPHPAP